MIDEFNLRERLEQMIKEDLKRRIPPKEGTLRCLVFEHHTQLKELRKLAYEALGAGYGRQHTWREIAATISEIHGSEVTPQYLRKVFHEIDKTYFATTSTDSFQEKN